MTGKPCPTCGHVAQAGPDALTPRQLDILRAIVDWIDRCGFAPTNTEMSVAVGGVRHQTITDALRELERKGWIRRTARHRGVQVLHRPPETSETHRRPVPQKPTAGRAKERRDCLQCRRPFMSAGPGDWVCDSCEASEEWSSGNDLAVGA